MRVAFGFKAHSGWAALVVVGQEDDDWSVVDRRRVELVEADKLWAKQPYHAAEELPPVQARKVVQSGIEHAQRLALRELRSLVESTQAAGNTIAGCAVLVGEPMPGWTVDEILAVHFRMHKAEGVLFRRVLAQAAKECGLKVLEVSEKSLLEQAPTSLGSSIEKLTRLLTTLGKSVGPPWGKDQKEAALAAMMALSAPAKKQVRTQKT
ncbi:MAG TPA: hypothetical protein VKB46_19645 [Pyrinomonadaceae bacterium]|nr:hypothetical protein [Pyrinomonadaceae bacterium]